MSQGLHTITKVEPVTNRDIEIKELDSEDIPRWNQYVAESPRATFCHRIEWKHIIGKSFGHKTDFLMASKEDNID